METARNNGVLDVLQSCRYLSSFMMIKKCHHDIRESILGAAASSCACNRKSVSYFRQSLLFTKLDSHKGKIVLKAAVTIRQLTCLLRVNRLEPPLLDLRSSGRQPY